MKNTEIKLIGKIQIKSKEFFTKDLKNKFLVLYLVIILMYLLIGSYIYFTGKLLEWFHYKEYAIGLKYLFIVNSIVLLILFIYIWHKKELKNFKKPICFGILACIIFGIISTIYAYDTNIALEGCWGRYEGLFSILYYLTLMLLSTQVSPKYKKFLVKVILVCGAIHAIYAICQVFSLFNVKQYFHTTRVWDKSIQANVTVNEIWALGFTNNPNFLGTYMLLGVSYSFGLFIDSVKKYKCIIYAILSCLFMFGLLISNTLAAVVGLFFVLIYVFIYCLKNKNYEKFIVVFAIILSITCLAVALNKTTLIKDVIKTGKETTEIVKGNLDDNYGSKRMYIWKETMKIVPNHLIHGVGIDSFHKAFNGEALVLKLSYKNILYDKAHNEYLQILVTQGVFALASYLFVYGYAIYKGTKIAFNNKKIYLILPVIRIFSTSIF